MAKVFPARRREVELAPEDHVEWLRVAEDGGVVDHETDPVGRTERLGFGPRPPDQLGLDVHGHGGEARVELHQREEATAQAAAQLHGLIRRRRLHKARSDLGTPDRSQLPIAAIATSWGFVDAGHFSRAFKAEYGQTATD
nr:helix-turn-helix domain-containing protein [Actinoplanes auranticolor]